MNKTTKRSKAAIVASLITLVRPMLPIMFCAILMGVAGYFCATFITIFGGFAILGAAGLPTPVATAGTAFACMLVFALLRGVLRYAEQASNHFIAFKLLALIRDKVFGALRRLTPAKLEGRENAAELRAELTARASEARERLHAIDRDHVGARRLLRAFPDMYSARYEESLTTTREALRRLQRLAQSAKEAAADAARLAAATARDAAADKLRK